MTINHKKGFVSASILASVAILLSLVAIAVSWNNKPEGNKFGAVGAITGMLAENYIPYVLYNQGYNSALDITTTGNTTLASSTATTLKVGQVGTGHTRINSGTCNIHAGVNTISASSSVQVDCQSGTGTQTALSNLPAWAAGDKTFLSFASSTPTTIQGLIINGASASTTAGFITAIISNHTGTTFTWTALASSTLQYLFIR